MTDSYNRQQMCGSLHPNTHQTVQVSHDRDYSPCSSGSALKAEEWPDFSPRILTRYVKTASLSLLWDSGYSERPPYKRTQNQIFYPSSTRNLKKKIIDTLMRHVSAKRSQLMSQSCKSWVSSLLLQKFASSCWLYNKNLYISVYNVFSIIFFFSMWMASLLSILSHFATKREPLIKGKI